MYVAASKFSSSQMKYVLELHTVQYNTKFDKQLFLSLMLLKLFEIAHFKLVWNTVPYWQAQKTNGDILYFTISYCMIQYYTTQSLLNTPSKHNHDWMAQSTHRQYCTGNENSPNYTVEGNNSTVSHF